jgi:hypothetical protein
VAKKTVNRTKYQLEDNVKRVLFLNRGQENNDPFAIPYATRAEADAGIALDKVMNPDVSAYAYDRLRHSAQHSAGKGTSVATLQPVSGVVPVDCRRSNVFGLTFTENLLLGNPVNGFSGQVINFIFQQDGTGSRTITFGDAYAFVGGFTPQLSTAAGAVDLMSCQYYPSLGLWLCSWLPDYTGTGTGSLTLPEGPQGPAGATGATGATGAAGADGADGVVQAVVAGTGISVDSTDPANPIVSATGGGGATSLVDLIDVTGTDYAADGEALVFDAATGLWMPGAVAAAGGSSQPVDDGAHVSRVATQSLTNTTAAAITFDTEVRDDGGYYDAGSPTRLTITNAGWYVLTGSVQFAANATGLRRAYFRVNNTTDYSVASVNAVSSAGLVTVPVAAAVLYLAAGDYVELWARQDSGGSLNTALAECQIHRLGVASSPSNPINDGCAVTRQSTQALTATTWAAVSWTAEERDDGNYWDAGDPTKITFANAGWYAISASVRFSATSGRDCALQLQKNGTMPSTGTRLGFSFGYYSTGNSAQLTDIRYFAAGDYITLCAYSTATENVAAGSPWASLSVHRLGTNQLPSGGTTGQALVKASDTDGDVEWGAAVGGGGGSSQPVDDGARVYRSTSQSIANNTTTAIQFDTVERDDNDYADLGTNNDRLTILEAGWYVVSGSLRYAVNATGARSAWLEANGANAFGMQRIQAVTTASTNTNLTAVGVRYFAAGDYVRLMASQSSGGALDVEYAADQAPYLSIHRLGVASSPGNPVNDGASVTRATSQAIAAFTSTAISWSSATRDDGGYWAAGSPTRFTVPNSGWYVLSGYIRWASTATGQRSVWWRANGSTNLSGTDAPALVATMSGRAHCLAYLTAGDYVELMVRQGSAGSIDIDVTYDPPSAQIHRLGTPPATSTHVVNGRLTLTSGTPVTTSDVTGATSVYFTPFNGNTVTLWDGSVWVQKAFTETTLALGTLTSGKPYDVFGYLSSGALALEALVWTNDTTRATAVTLQDGRYCKSGDKTRLYLGTFYTTSTTTTEDSLSKRYLFNQYSRVTRDCASPLETTNSWNYSTATWRQANAAATNQFEYVNGDPAHRLRANVLGIAINSGAGGTSVAVGVGIDSTSTNSARLMGQNLYASDIDQTRAEYFGHPGAGRHYVAWLEYSQAVGTTTWYGDVVAGVFQSGIFGEVDL